MKLRWLFMALVAIALIGGGLLVFTKKNDSIDRNKNVPDSLPQIQAPRLSVNGHVIYLDIANTPEKRTQGLSGRNSMPIDHGMLFVFDSLQKPGFWMYEMKFPLDFVWINGDSVVQINENVPFPTAGGPIATVNPEFDVDKVLEINAGVINSTVIKVRHRILIDY